MLKLRRLKLMCGTGCIFALLPNAPAIGAQQTQQAQSPATAKPPSKDPAQNRGTGVAPGQTASPENDRIFGVVPNYNTVHGVNVIPPLTVKEKFTLAAKGTFDPYEFPIVALIALRAQAQNDDPAWGQGMKGYGDRYGAAFGDQLIGGFMTSAIFPSMLKQDPRYYRRGEGRFLARAGYSVSRIIVGRSDSGNRMFNYSEFGGNAVAAGISDAYHTSDQRTISGTASSWGTQMGIDVLGNLAKEFWPDIKQGLRRKHKAE